MSGRIDEYRNKKSISVVPSSCDSVSCCFRLTLPRAHIVVSHFHGVCFDGHVRSRMDFRMTELAASVPKFVSADHCAL